jgi:hypothetical protein
MKKSNDSIIEREQTGYLREEEQQTTFSKVPTIRVDYTRLDVALLCPTAERSLGHPSLLVISTAGHCWAYIWPMTLRASKDPQGILSSNGNPKRLNES